MTKFLLLFLLLILYSSCVEKKSEINLSDGESSTLSESKKQLLQTTLVNETKFQKQIICNGIIESSQKSDLRFKSSDRIASIKVKNGQSVKKGQIIAVLDNLLLENQIQKEEINLLKANYKVQEEKINYGVSNDVESNTLKNIELNSGKLDALNSLNNAQLLYNQTFLIAPFDGVIANIETKVGNFISPSDIFCTIINPEKLEVSFNILENNIPFVNENQEIVLTTFFDSQKEIQAKIIEVNPIVDKNGLIKVKAELKNSDSALFEGMNVKIYINNSINNSIVIPKEAIVLRSNREVVFTLNKGFAKWNYVEILDENSTSYAIKSGLKIGDTIIVSGNMNLSHDAKVNTTFIPQQ